MGIKGLIPFLNEKVPGSMTEMTLESLSGEYIAVDASTALYQFTIAIRDSSYFSSLVNSSGESTSHLYGMMSRCSKLLECGIKPVFVFDSKPPELKLKTLEKRRQRREEASTSLKQAIAEGDKESIKKLMGRTVKVTKEMNDSAKKLLRLMGVPVIEALEEAEAQCAYLVRNSLCRFVASEDTDTLAFGGGYLLRNVTASSNKKIVKVDLQKALNGLDLTFEQFVDFCILCGCDYCDTLEGVGPKTAYTLVKRHSSLEEIVNIKGGNYDDFKEAKEYFMAPKVNDFDQASVKMGTLDAEALTDFLVNENNFAKERVDKFVEKLLKFRGKKVQTSLLSFLSSQPAKNQLKDSGKRPRTSKSSVSLKKAKTEFGSRASLSSSTRVSSKKTSDDLNVTVDKYNKADERVGNEEDEDDLFKLSFGNNNEDEGHNVDDQSVFKSKEVMDVANEDENVQNPKVEDGGMEYQGGKGLFDDSDNEELGDSWEERGKEENKDDNHTGGMDRSDESEQTVEKKEEFDRESPVKSEESEVQEKQDDKTTFESDKFEMPTEDVKLELKLGSNKRVLFDDDDDDELTTATSENMNCETDSVKGQEEKKGLRNLFDVLVPYPKPVKRSKTNSIYTKASGFNFNNSKLIGCTDHPEYFTGHSHSSRHTSHASFSTYFNLYSRIPPSGDISHNNLLVNRIFTRFITSTPNSDSDCADGLNPTSKKVHKVEGVVIPDNLVKFIVIEEFIPLVTFHNIFSSDPSDLDGAHDSVFESNIFERNRLLHSTRASLFKDSDASDEAKKLRLKRLMSVSYSHGISWDTLDNLYFDFFKAKTEALNFWDESKLDLIQFAKQVALSKINSSDILSQFRSSGRLLKLFTQQYYKRWFNCYMHPFSTGMLIKYLKAHVTLALLNRESNELRNRGVELHFTDSPSNPYFKNVDSK
ncbi:5'-3' exonuclease [Theileria orientalis]|uniref:Flap endonuclease 1 n=1 Tax=Theileria orientalis TaxID=68886 RepID=A0A976MC42_THEOR|nr:5'-3' exonuclease [Theileria orientalis]